MIREENRVDTEELLELSTRLIAVVDDEPRIGPFTFLRRTL